MDAIADRAFQEKQHNVSQDETPSLLAVVIDTNPLEWTKLKGVICLKELCKSVLVLLNAHLSLNSGNRVAVLTSSSLNSGPKFLYPDPNDKTYEKRESLLSSDIHRQFKFVDQKIIQELQILLDNEPLNPENQELKGSIAGAMSMALSYINRLTNIEPESTGNTLRAKMLVISISDDSTQQYVPFMNCIFSAQKMKVSIDVCKMGPDSSFLQQASDVTNGVYMLIKNVHGLIQYLTTALFIDPSLRPIMVLPTNSDLDFRASCFVTNKVIDIGYVCSVCLCIFSIIPRNNVCPTCQSKFDDAVVKKLRQKPIVIPLQKKKKLEDGVQRT
ncbi:TFIIH subunit [Komagataella phaffii]|uniref:General transcription and DNA repair factor IIH subunit TFB4 n=1 Tax=Komagataella phaffii (strain GS115 / ATCC 20864) TaxID=644223 RepID=C4QZG9_KOMPG|nr:uncharacterized protein PAS_chr2-1_0043 [Komagataella phaffii GS115]CAY68643.1 Subunit of TFIIH complex, involved in transcription initiation, similar to 34 kDa subunit of human T [Komagataella phaffii GS115]